MKHKLVRYKVKPEALAEHRRLIKGVFGALLDQSPEDVGYMVIETGCGGFVHLKTDFGDETFELGELPAFQAFGKGIIERCIEPPQSSEATIIGRYTAKAA